MDTYTFESEVKFYREVLRISYELGSRLLKEGILNADARMADGRPLFSISEKALKHHFAALAGYKAKHKRALEKAYV